MLGTVYQRPSLSPSKWILFQLRHVLSVKPIQLGQKGSITCGRVMFCPTESWLIVEHIVYMQASGVLPSICCPSSTFSNDFLSEAVRSILFICHINLL